MRELVLMAEYGITSGIDNQLPLWEGHTLVEDVTLSPKLTELLLKWNAEYDKSDYTKDFEDTAFVETGRYLAINILKELGDGVDLWYHNEVTQQKEHIGL